MGNISGGDCVGGVTGKITGTINSWNNLKYCYNVGNISGKKMVGGITGHNDTAHTIYTYNFGSVTGTEYVGGIVGNNSSGTTGGTSTIQNCYNVTEDIIANNYKGAICGRSYGSNYTTADIFSSYYFKINSSIYGVGGKTSTTGNNDGCTAYSDIDSMPTIMSVINGNNAFVEDTEGINNGYPLLAWQVQTSE